MSRIPQPEGQRGSLKWLQKAVNEAWPSLNQPIADYLGGGQSIEWRSPLADDDFAEYRDGAFLGLLGLSELRPKLLEFWPARGPQWDALGLSSNGTILLVEAKAHIAEMCSPASAASPASLKLIKHSLESTAAELKARDDRADWHSVFYQLTNRLAHLNWMRSQGIDARLVMVNFVNDHEMSGPTSASEWMAAYHVALHALGLRHHHALVKYVLQVFPDVTER